MVRGGAPSPGSGSGNDTENDGTDMMSIAKQRSAGVAHGRCVGGSRFWITNVVANGRVAGADSTTCDGSAI